ncbi:hypothetical protein [Fictibacillus sp. S7]|uniref:hypothetical protein n=1 Tax=Fictibacillus sp. S7 TaxID=2212476 RepID=UPI00101352B7|nr:hypothetical protein [Fictibacillus sp. S7]
MTVRTRSLTRRWVENETLLTSRTRRSGSVSQIKHSVWRDSINLTYSASSNHVKTTASFGLITDCRYDEKERVR